MSKRVAVIGAGPSGVVTVKELLDEGHQPTCFERAADLGGVFRFGERDGVVWDSVRLVSSGLITAFSDFPVTPAEAEHMSARQYADYLSRYCDTFGVRPHIRFSTTVESVTRDSTSGWHVRSVDVDGARHEAHFDAVAVCSGLHQHPHIPEFPGRESFTGTVIHGARYRRPSEVAGKRVLVVGAGESGADIVSEVSGTAAETVLSTRRGVSVVPRRNYGKPNDYRVTRLNHSAAHWVAATHHPADDWKRRVYLAAFFPLAVVDKILKIASFLLYDYLPIFHPRRLVSGRAGLDAIRADLGMRREIARLLEESGGTKEENFGTKTEAFTRAIAMGRIRRAGAISRFEGARVVFDDGSSYEPDVVICATGFDTKVPYLDDTLVRTPRYLFAFNPDVGETLGFIGFVRPSYGAIPPMCEIQARWFAQLISEHVTLPPRARMLEGIEQTVATRQHIFRPLRDRLDYLVDHTSACDLLADTIGVKPTREAVSRESFRFRFRFYAAPFATAQYRMIGPHAKPALAREVIENLPISETPPMITALYLRWMLSRLLHSTLGDEFKPKLQLQTGTAAGRLTQQALAHNSSSTARH